jgi:hypothetical protein
MSVTRANFDKSYWWDNNLAWLRRQPELWKNGKLAYSYREMIGISGRKMYQRMERLLPSPAYFCGVDNDPLCLLEHVLDKVPFALVHGGFYTTSIEALRAQKGGRGPKIGVLNFDTMDSALNKWWQQHSPHLKEIRKHGMEGCPAFTMILNHVLNMGGGEEGGSMQHRIQQHGEALLQTLGDWVRPKDRPLFTHVSDQYDHSKLPTKIGAYDIYRSKDETGHENVAVMITVRLTFRQAQKRVLFDQAA